MHTYRNAWNEGDLDTIVQTYATPCFVVKGGRVLHHPDEAAKRAYFGELLAGNQAQGSHVWHIAELDDHALGADAALTTVRWVAQRPDRSVLWDFVDSYLLALDSGQWRILGDVVQR
jgi:hypothetical protein